MGIGWNCSWLSYIQDLNDGDDNRQYGLQFWMQGGGQVNLQPNLSNYDTNFRYQRITNGGGAVSIKILYPSGATDLYARKLTAFLGGHDAYFLTQKSDPSGNSLTLNYTNAYAQLISVADPENRLTILSYTNLTFPNLVTAVTDPFGRTAKFQHDLNQRLTNITDVGGVSSWFSYGTVTSGTGSVNNIWLTNLVTPYGTTGFKMTDFTGDYHLGDSNRVARSVEVTLPDGGKELFLYRSDSSQLNLTNATPLVPSSFPGEVPSTTPYSNTFDTGNLNLRNSFHWGPKQYSNLSTNYTWTGDFNNLTTNDYFKATLKHWLWTAGGAYVDQALSMQRDPSTDGTNQGQKTWYDYVGKPASYNPGNQILPLFIARLLPDASSSFTRFERNGVGNVTAEVSTYSVGSNVYVRTNCFVYDANSGVDFIMTTNAINQLISSNLFNSLHLIATNWNASNEMTRFQYDTAARLTNVVFPNGLNRQIQYYTSAGTNLDNLGFPKQLVDVGYQTNAFTYSKGLVSVYTDELMTATTNYWDNLQRLIGQQFWDGTTSSNIYYKRDGAFANSTGGTNLLDLTGTKDRLGYWSYFNRDPMRRVAAFINARNLTKSYSYCACGSLESVQYPSGAQETFGYDNLGRLTSRTVAVDGRQYFTYDAVGRLLTQTDGVGVRTNYYNNQGLLVAITNDLGGQISIGYDVLDRPTNTVNSAGVTITNSYDALGRLIVNALPQAGSTETLGYTPNWFLPTSYTNALTNVFTYAYDGLNRRTNEIAVGLRTNSFSYNPSGSLASLTNGNGNTRSWTYDQEGRLFQKIDPAGRTYTFTYYPTGWLSNRVDSLVHATAYDYDAVGNLSKIRYLSQGTTNSYLYDNDDRMYSMSDAVGTSGFDYSYCGDFSMLNTETAPWPNSQVAIWYYPTAMLNAGYRIYSSSLNPIDVNLGVASATRYAQVATSPGGSYTYGYLGSSKVIKSVNLPNGGSVANVLDLLARLDETRLKSSGGGTLNLHQYGYDAASRRTAITNLYGNYWTNRYDLSGQLTNAQGFESGGSTTRWHEQFTYRYDPAGNLVNRTNYTLSQSFVVNNLDELTSVSRSGTITVAGTVGSPGTNVTSVTVADNGNAAVAATVYGDKTFVRTNVTVLTANTFTAVAQDAYGRKDTNSIATVLPSSASYTYDYNGNLTGDGLRIFSYDQENQLISVVVTNGVGSSTRSDFVYDGLFRLRIRREWNWQSSAWLQLGETHYLYSGNRVVQERDADNIPTVTYTRGVDFSGNQAGANGVGGLLARTDHGTGATMFYHSDGNGNVTEMINAQQAIVARYSYDPFGNLLSKSGPLADANVYRFSSKEYHAASGLYYYGYRWYDPNLQRWINRDPIGEAGGINLYGYVGNSPVNYIDPYGLEVGFWESLIPVWGSGKQACEDFESGHWAWGTANAAVAISDVVPLKSAGSAVAKGAWKCGSHTWSATSKWLTKCGWREFKGQEMHHWAIPRNEWGANVPGWLKNQPWNLMPMPNAVFHDALHGVGQAPFVFGERLWYGTPTWLKTGAFSLGGKEANWLFNDGGSSFVPPMSSPVLSPGGAAGSPALPYPQ